MRNLNLKRKRLTTLALALLLAGSISASCKSDIIDPVTGVQQDTTVIMSVNVGGVHSYKVTDGVSTYHFKYKGKISVSDDDKSIESISPGGYLSITKTTFGNRRTLNIESNSRGELSYTYYEGRNEVPFEPDGKIWLDDVLLDVIRMTGIDAEGRAHRIYFEGGTSGVLEEIDKISSNHVKSVYFRILLSEENLTNEDLSQIAIKIGTSISSNSERGNLYRDFSGLFVVNDQVSANYFRGISKLSSNSERGSILRNAIRSHDLSERQFADLLSVAAKISSNSERGSVLRSIEELDLSDQEVVDAYFGVIDGMSSSSEIGSTMRHLIKQQELEEEATIRLLNSLKKVSSSSEKGSVLRTLEDIHLTSKEVIIAYFGVVNSIGSSSEQGEVLRHLINFQPLNKATMIALLITTREISSNSEKGSVLRTSVRWIGEQDEKVMDVFFQAVNSLSSSSEHGSVLKHLIHNTDIVKYSQLMLLESAEEISSNSEKASVLITLAEKTGLEDAEVKEAYLRAAKTISSDSEYRRVVDKIF